MVTKEKIDQFYKDVDNLKLRFPVAELVRMTGYSKSQISQVLGRMLSPSEDLMKEFYKSLNKVSSTNNDALAAYERLIEEKEARRLDAVAWAQTMEAHYKDMKEALVRAQYTINEVLKPIKDQTEAIFANSKETADDISALTSENLAAHRALMDSVDVAAKQPIGTTREAAGIVEIASEKARVGKGMKDQAGVGKTSK